MRDASVRTRTLTSTGVSPTLAVVLMSVVTIASAGNARADEYLNLIGGHGGGPFQVHCPAGQFLAGFELRAADDVDAIRPLCVQAYGPREVSAAAPVSGWYGGTGGGPASVVCPGYTPIVTGVFVRWEGVDTQIVNNIHLYCAAVDGEQSASNMPAAMFDAPQHQAGGFGTKFALVGKDSQGCANGQLAVGLHGRSGIWVDAIGLICALPIPAGNVVTSIGRVGPPSPPGQHKPICDAARDARARNSPAAPNLEAQCEASKTVVTSIGKKPVNGPIKPGPVRTICEAARDARARNSPAAPNLEAQCRASGGDPGLPGGKP